MKSIYLYAIFYGIVYLCGIAVTGIIADRLADSLEMMLVYWTLGETAITMAMYPMLSRIWDEIGEEMGWDKD